MSETIRQFDVGTEIVLDMVEDISGATDRKIIFRSPRGITVFERAAIAEGTTKILYTTVAEDITLAGLWMLQGFVRISANEEFYSKSLILVVEPTLKQVEV